jgi:hypothetical protein
MKRRDFVAGLGLLAAAEEKRFCSRARLTRCGPNNPSLNVLIPHDSVESLMTYQQKLSGDAAYAKAAREYLESSFSNPAYSRKERGLMRAFAGMPRVESAHIRTTYL